MDNTLRKAAEMAFEALNEVTGWQWAGPMRVMDEVEDAIEALRQALAQPEQSKYSDIVSDGGLDPRNKFDAQQEPVAWMDKVWMKRPDLAKEIHMNKMFSRCQLSDKQVPLYTAPLKQWVGLTDDEIEDTWGNTPMMFNARDNGARRVFARAIEAKLKDKNK